jgi:uncharacterized protein YndB with AHSA1/START domain
MMTQHKTTHARKDDTTITPISDTEIRITRTFHAPRALVWKAMTTPEHFRNWYGPRDTKITSCVMDFRVGGKWRVVMTAGNGQEVAFSGEYLEIRAPERTVQTWRFEPFPDAESTESMTLEDRGETTRMSVNVKHVSAENLQGHLQSGMEEGMRETYERLDELVESMKR